MFNPSTGKVIAKVPFCSTDEVNKVIEAAAAAGPEWANKPDGRIIVRIRTPRELEAWLAKIDDRQP